MISKENYDMLKVSNECHIAATNFTEAPLINRDKLN